MARRLVPALLGLMIVFHLLAGGPAHAWAESPALRVMTFNVRLPHAQDGANNWEHRRDLLVKTIADTEPDVVATQELFKKQGDYIIEHLPEYAWFGAGRRGGHEDEHMGVFYRRDRLRLLELGDFWLSDTPAVPGSLTWDHPLPRMVTWGLFETKADGRRFYLLNTHFPYRAEDTDARVKGARLIQGRIAGLPADVPVILTGDFNAVPSGPVHELLTKTLVDARTAAPSTSGPDATFHNFTGKADRRIDWILLRGFRPEAVRTVTTHRDALYPSDHFPVIAEVEWAGADGQPQ